jgi:hypothetical protein
MDLAIKRNVSNTSEVSADICLINKKFWEELAYLSLIRQGPHRHRQVQQFFYCYVCIRCRGNVLLLTRCLATTVGLHLQTYKLMGSIYEVRCLNGLRRHDIHTKFHKVRFRHSKVEMGYTNTQKHRQRDLIRLLSLVFSK